MRVLLHTPPRRDGVVHIRLGRCGGSTKAGEVWPPVLASTTAACLRGAGHEVHVLDAQALDLTRSEFSAEAARFRPDLALTEVTPPSLGADRGGLEALRAACPGVVTGAYGCLASAVGELDLPADHVLVGEPEPAALELVRLLEGGEAPRVVRAPAPLDLAKAPMPAHDLLPLHAYSSPFPFARSPYATTQTMRGCPYPCTFCNSRVLFGAEPRYVPSERVLSELRWLARDLGVRELKFNDECFTLDMGRARDICRGMASEGLDLTWECNTRADALDALLVRDMRAAGCHLIYIGVESGSQRVLDGLRKGQDLARVEEAFRLCRAVGIRTLAHFMIGCPGETQESLRETLALARRLGATYASFNVFVPYPGTTAFAEAEARGVALPREWERYDQSCSCPVSLGSLSPRELEAEVRRAYRSFYLWPPQALRIAADGVRHLPRYLRATARFLRRWAR